MSVSPGIRSVCVSPAGNGMYGDVFLAKAPGLASGPGNEEQLVCVKRLTNKEESVQIEFRAEMEMFHKLSHDRICRLLAVCKEAEPIYMVMEYCEWVRARPGGWQERCFGKAINLT